MASAQPVPTWSAADADSVAGDLGGTSYAALSPGLKSVVQRVATIVTGDTKPPMPDEAWSTWMTPAGEGRVGRPAGSAVRLVRGVGDPARGGGRPRVAGHHAVQRRAVELAVPRHPGGGRRGGRDRGFRVQPAGVSGGGVLRGRGRDDDVRRGRGEPRHRPGPDRVVVDLRLHQGHGHRGGAARVRAAGGDRAGGPPPVHRRGPPGDGVDLDPGVVRRGAVRAAGGAVPDHRRPGCSPTASCPR